MAQVVSMSGLMYGSRKKVELLNLSIGQMTIAGLNQSVHRNGKSVCSKISSAARVVDFISAGQIAYYRSDSNKMVYLEIGENTAEAVKIICSEEVDGYEVRCSENAEALGGYHSVRVSIIPSLLYEIVMGENDELQDVFREILGEISNPGSSMIDNLYLMCDSFYYGCAKGKKVHYTADLTESEIMAAFRSGLFKKVAGSAWKKSDFDTAKPMKAKAEKKDDKGQEFMQACMAGKYRIGYDWPEQMKKFIVNKSYLEKFEYTPEFEEILRKIKFRADRILERMDMGLTGAEAIGKDALNIAIVGKPGTGKTALAYALSAATGMPVSSTIWQKNSEEDEGEGKTKIVDGKPMFVETYSLLAHQYGGIDVNEEINLADPGVTMGVLGQKLEYPFIIKKNGYEPVTRHPLNIVIATMNVGTNGSNTLNEALKNRLIAIFQLEDPTRGTFINILEKATAAKREICEWVYDAYDAVVSYLKDPDINEEEICMGLSIRTCIGAIENMEEGQEPLRALKNSIVGSIAMSDRELAERVYDEKISVLPNPAFAE